MSSLQGSPMKCPGCGLINAATAERCDCGRSFVDGSVVLPQPPPIRPGEHLRRAGCAIGLLGFFGGVAVSIASLGMLRDGCTLIAVIGFTMWVIGSLRMRAARHP
jgi:hypothetical protein